MRHLVLVIMAGLALAACHRSPPVTTQTTTVRVGDSVAFFEAVRIEARDPTGARIAGFAPLVDARPASVVQLRDRYLVAVGAGAGAVTLRQIRMGRSSPIVGPAARVDVTVVNP